jgi:hypothetical protein
VPVVPLAHRLLQNGQRQLARNFPFPCMLHITESTAIVKNNDLGIFKDVHVLSAHLTMEDLFLKCRMIRLYIFMYGAPRQHLKISTDFISYFAFRGLYVIDRCPVNMNILAQETGALQIFQKKYNDNFLESN